MLVAVTAPATTHAKPGAAHAPEPKTHSADAPADEYFGPLKMSAIGIRMRIDVLGRRYIARSESDTDLVHDAADVASSMSAWNAKYPHDLWAAPTAFHLAQLYANVQSDDARAKARSEFAAIANAYPKSSYGHLARLRIAQGFPPLHDESPVVAAATGAPPTAVPAVANDPVSDASPLPIAAPVAASSP
jgi:hypothetical protein